MSQYSQQYVDNPYQGGHVVNCNLANEMTHIDDWTQQELLQWIINLQGVSVRNQNALIKTITENEVSGKDFNSSVECKQDVAEAFPGVTSNGVNNIYAGFEILRHTQQAYNVQPAQSDGNDNNKLKQEYNLLQQKFNELAQQCSDLKKENANKEENTRHLKAINASLKEENIDQQKKYNLLLEKYNKALNDDELRKCGNDELRKANSDLNVECKELKLELKDIKEKYNKWVRQNNDYTTWDYNIITHWIIGLDKQFIEYENELRQQLKNEEITGTDLINLDKNDLNRFGIRVFKHKTRILEEIQKLVCPQNNNIQNNDNIMPYNEGKHETAYIEQ